MTEQQTARRFPVPAIIAFVLVAALLLTLAVLSTIKSVRTAASDATVVRVQDGQTIVVNRDGTEETVTLAGVLAPVPAGEGKEPTVENCLGEESTANLSGLLEPGDTVRLEYPDDADGPRGTRLALVHHGGRTTNTQQVEAGLAVPLREQPMEHFGTELREAQETARTEGGGLYSPGEPCTLAGRIAPALTVLQDLPEAHPDSSGTADTQIEAVEAAVEEGISAEKVFATIDPEGSSLASLAWGQDLPRMQDRLNGALSSAQSDLDSLRSTRDVLLTREREEQARKEEEARKAAAAAAAEAERQRQEAAAAAQRAEQQRQEEAAQRQRAQESAKAKESAEAKESAKAEESPTPEESESASPTPSPTPSSTPPPSSPSPSSESASSPDDSESESEG
ncbi:thermonuclease family protein [Citricoccus nitrophenolicus]|uniref:thermonuclease family protein n=1 Tax=Citricoccus nitrophenolicus TaxID=863575 RepID=UPI0039B5D381